ncbi:hypothetical protein LB553_00910 [Mesorhizobium sp. CA8]|uniref:hypothetical protein n=1 Tax=Mesorhizobium sp. CA8 TaxID=2876637 RepID=UPI001CCF7343|nr:hypothetical protein [Mesorhizobium sp. CA8]MBZ9759447.1 hypothetical protein [Mesorhizobium sp. CA8]
MSDFTPGPWHLEISLSADDNGLQQCVIANETVEVCEVSGAVLVRGEFHPENMANARLIAAAPDMLAALKEVAARLGPRWFLEQNWDAPIAAILKAEGRAAIAGQRQ